MQIHCRFRVRIVRLYRSRIESVGQIRSVDGGRDVKDVVVGAVVDSAVEGDVGADELLVGTGQGGALDVVSVTVAAVEDGGVENFGDLVDVGAIEQG